MVSKSITQSDIWQIDECHSPHQQPSMLTDLVQELHFLY